MKKFIFIILLCILALLGVWKFLNNLNNNEIKQNTKHTTATTTPNEPKNTIDKKKNSIDDPSSQWIIVNKKRPIPIDFVPDLAIPEVKLRLLASSEQMQINKQTAPQIKKLFIAAESDNITLVFGSGYRSGVLQKQFYDSYKNRDGQAAADTYSARPGYSEHQTGFSADITSNDGKCHLEICWESTPEGQWLKANAHKYGFIIRYPKDKQNYTGYQYEPWHIRYVGDKLANEIYQSNKTLEEFFELPAATNYD